MSAGQYAGICNVMCAWHVSMQGGALSRSIVPLYSMECQQVEHMPMYIYYSKGQCYACNIVYVINGIMFNILAKGMYVHGGDSCMY